LPFDVARFGETLTECGYDDRAGRTKVEKSDYRHPRMLRARGERPVFLIGSQITVGQQAPVIKRTDLLKTALPEMEGKGMNVWVADIPPSASTGRHSHPTPRFVYVIEGAVVYEVDGKQPQTFKTGEAYVEMPGEVHNFRSASTTQPARALGFQYANKGQALQTNAP
jgi:quercetin dioxygenase-like cupin family protein